MWWISPVNCRCVRCSPYGQAGHPHSVPASTFVNRVAPLPSISILVLFLTETTSSERYSPPALKRMTEGLVAVPLGTDAIKVLSNAVTFCDPSLAIDVGTEYAVPTGEGLGDGLGEGDGLG